MGHGYEWASMLKITASVGLGMSILMLVLFISIYYKRRQFGVILVTTSVLTVTLLAGSSYLFYQATYSKERHTLDHVDNQIMHIVDLHERVRFLLLTVPESKGIDGQQIKQAISLARDYLREIEQSVVDIEGRGFLNNAFMVAEKKNLSKGASVGYLFGGFPGLAMAALIAFLASVYMALRYYFDPISVTDIGLLITVVVFIAIAFLTSHREDGSFNPLIVLLLFPALIVGFLHYCTHKFSELFLEITVSVILVLCVGLFTFSSLSLDIYGEDRLLARLKAVNDHSPMIASRAKGLGTKLDELLAINRFEEGWDKELIGLTYPIFYSIGGLEENLGNSIPQSDDPAELHIFNPYKDEYENFKKEYKMRLGDKL